MAVVRVKIPVTNQEQHKGHQAQKENQIIPKPGSRVFDDSGAVVVQHRYKYTCY